MLSKDYDNHGHILDKIHLIQQNNRPALQFNAI